MRKALLLLAIICLPLFVSAQTQEKQYYIYNIIALSGSWNKEGFRVDIDDGKTVERLKDSKGDKMRFKTPSAALMYLISEGWELYVNGTISEGSSYKGTGSSNATIYWIMRKPCTKEEFEKAVKEGINTKE